MKRDRFSDPCPAGLRFPHLRPKRKFRSEIEAIGQLAIIRARRDFDPSRDECDYYVCQHCGWVHLTSQHRSTIGLVWTGKEIKHAS